MLGNPTRRSWDRGGSGVAREICVGRGFIIKYFSTWILQSSQARINGYWSLITGGRSQNLRAFSGVGQHLRELCAEISHRGILWKDLALDGRQCYSVWFFALGLGMSRGLGPATEGQESKDWSMMPGHKKWVWFSRGWLQSTMPKNVIPEAGLREDKDSEDCSCREYQRELERYLLPLRLYHPCK